MFVPSYQTNANESQQKPHFEQNVYKKMNKLLNGDVLYK